MGTQASPLRQISAAITRAQPGDVILVDSGQYAYTEVRGFRGSTDAWLAIMTLTDQTAAIIHVPSPTDNFVNIVDSQFVGLYGFEVYGDLSDPNTNGSGISVYGNSHHVAIWANSVHDFPGGGVNCFDVGGSHDLVDVSYNKIYRTSRYSPNNTSGISIYGARDLTAGELFPDGYGFRVVGNYVHDVLCTVPYTPGGYDYITDGNGVSIDCLLTTHNYQKRVLVSGNLITGCGGRAVHVNNSVNTLVTENTVAGNLRTSSPAITGGAEIDGTTDKSVRHVQNVVFPTGASRTCDSTSSYAGNIFLGGVGSVPRGNTDARSSGIHYFAGPLDASMLINGTGVSAFQPAAN
jgi:hypothetical protein